jgi:hypothetical protein
VVAGDQAYERFRFAGDEAMVGSVFASFFMGDYVLFGEAATDQDGAVAAIAGVSANLGRTVRAVVSTRSYSRGFTNLHSYAFGESSGSTQNERGMYLGVQIRPNTRWRFAGFVDQYRFPWARFAVPRPSTGYEALGLVEHRPRRWILWYIQGRTETKAGGYRLQTPTLTELDALRDETRQSVRGHLQYEFSKRMTTRTRVEGIRFKSGGDDAGYGMLIYQDVQIALQSKLRLDTRIMLFDTDGFDARVFAYEYDLRYTFAVPAFSGQGQRMYAMLTYAPSRSFALQLKYGVTRYEHVETVGSGLDETEGNTLREVRAQLIWRP